MAARIEPLPYDPTRVSNSESHKARADHNQAHNDHSEKAGRSNIFAHHGTNAPIGRKPLDHHCVSGCLRRIRKTASSDRATVACEGRTKHLHGAKDPFGATEFGVWHASHAATVRAITVAPVAGDRSAPRENLRTEQRSWKTPYGSTACCWAVAHTCGRSARAPLSSPPAPSRFSPR